MANPGDTPRIDDIESDITDLQAVTFDGWSARGLNAAINTSGQEITATVDDFSNVDADPNSAFNASTGEYTVPAGKGGMYRVTGSIMISSTNNQTDIIRMDSRVLVQGSIVARYVTLWTGDSNAGGFNDSPTAYVTADVLAQAGETIRFEFLRRSSNGSANYNSQTSVSQVRFSGYWLGKEI